MRKIIGLLLLLPFSAFADVTFYGQCDYKGPSVVLDAGEYTAADLAKRGIPEDAIASVKVPEGFRVTLYENDGFKGRFGNLKSNDSCLDNNGFSNIVSSVTIVATQAEFGNAASTTFGNATLAPKKPAASTGKVTIYTDCNYGGLSAQLAEGDYNLAQLKKFGIGNNEISALKVPKGMTATVFDNDFLRGASASATGDIACLDQGDFANRITSISISGQGTATVAAPTAAAAAAGVKVFNQCNYRGKSATLKVGEYNNAQLNQLGIADNSIAAIQVADGYQVELFLNDFQRGGSGVLATNNPCLVGQYAKAISSVVVSQTGAASASKAKPVATFYAHCNYRGGSAELPVGKHNAQALRAAAIDDDSISSIKLAAGYRAVVYAGPAFNQRSMVVTSDDDCLDNDDMNDKISSIVIEPIPRNSNNSNFVAQPNQSNSSKSDDLIAGLTCVQQFVEKNACDARRWKAMETRCQLGRVDELSDGYLKGHVEAGNCNVELWDELVRRTANPHLR